MPEQSPSPKRTATAAANTTPQRIPNVLDLPIGDTTAVLQSVPGIRIQPTVYAGVGSGPNEGVGSVGTISVLQEFQTTNLINPNSTLSEYVNVNATGGKGPQNRVYVDLDSERKNRTVTPINGIAIQQQKEIEDRNLRSQAEEPPNAPGKDSPGSAEQVVQKSQIETLNTNEKEFYTKTRSNQNDTNLNLDTFISATPRRFQRPNRFRVCFDGLDGMSIKNPQFLITHQTAVDWLKKGLFCSNVTTPARTFETTELQLFGYDETYPTGTEFTSITCTFMVPIAFASTLQQQTLALAALANNPIYRFFVAWQNEIQNVRQNGYRTFKFPETYRCARGFLVEQFSDYVTTNEFNSITSKTRYYDVYPKTIQPSDLNWNAVDEFLTLQVEFLYTHWDDVTDTDPVQG